MNLKEIEFAMEDFLQLGLPVPENKLVKIIQLPNTPNVCIRIFKPKYTTEPSEKVLRSYVDRIEIFKSLSSATTSEEKDEYTDVFLPPNTIVSTLGYINENYIHWER